MSRKISLQVLVWDWIAAHPVLKDCSLHSENYNGGEAGEIIMMFTEPHWSLGRIESDRVIHRHSGKLIAHAGDPEFFKKLEAHLLKHLHVSTCGVMGCNK